MDRGNDESEHTALLLLELELDLGVLFGEPVIDRGEYFRHHVQHNGVRHYKRHESVGSIYLRTSTTALAR